MQLRKFQESDADQMAELLNNRNILDNLRDMIPYPYDAKDALEFIESCQQEAPQITFVIDIDGLPIGVIGLVLQEDIYKKSAEIGYWLGEPYWNHGYMTKAIGLMVDYGFNKLDLTRIFAGVFEYNKASRKVLEKAGFKFEGVFEKAVIKNGKLVDEYRYAVINPRYK